MPWTVAQISANTEKETVYGVRAVYTEDGFDPFAYAEERIDADKQGLFDFAARANSALASHREKLAAKNEKVDLVLALLNQ